MYEFQRLMGRYLVLDSKCQLLESFLIYVGKDLRVTDFFA